MVLESLAAPTVQILIALSCLAGKSIFHNMYIKIIMRVAVVILVCVHVLCKTFWVKPNMGYLSSSHM